MSSTQHLLALDWGTSSLRGVLLAPDGTVLEQVTTGDGILSVVDHDFEAVFCRLFGHWLARYPSTLVLAAGMIGSRQGWREAAYASCPTGFDELADAIVWHRVDEVRIGFVPGVMVEHASSNTPDVIRGEEIQIFGALDAMNVDSGIFVLPGTHSKWVEVRDRKIAGFHTYMTGELFALLRHQSILARLMPAGSDPAWPQGRDAFLRGCATAGNGTLLHDLFAIRASGLFDRLPAHDQADYLSGLLIGEEIREALATLSGLPPKSVYLVCNDALSDRYRAALSAHGIEGIATPANASFAGLLALANKQGWLEGHPASA